MAKQSKSRKKGKIKNKGHRHLESQNYWLPIAVVLLITIIIFFPSLQNDFVNWDDDPNILDNPYVKGLNWENVKGIFTTNVIGNYNPLPIFTFAIEHELFGFNPMVFHINNLLLHLVCVFLVYRIGLQLGLNMWASALLALLFGIHPMRVESVAWATERKDVLFGAFYLAAFYYYIKYLKTNEQRHYWLVLLLFVISLFSKIQAVALPLSLLAIDYYFKRPVSWKLLLNKIPFFALSLLFGVMGILILSADGSMEDSTNYSVIERLTVGAYSYSIYLIKFIFPYEMSPLYPYKKVFPVHYYAGFIGVIAMLFWFVRAWQKKHYATVFGISFFTFNVMFMLQIVGAGQGLLADRFTYIPYFGLFFMLAYAYQQIAKSYPQHQQKLRVGLGIYLLLFAAMTFQQCKIWENGKTLWIHVLKYYDDAPTPYVNLGHYYRDKNNVDLAVKNYSLALQRDNKVTVYNSRGKLYFENGLFEKALSDYNNGLVLVKDEEVKAEMLANRGVLYGRQGNLALALADLNESIRLDDSKKNPYSMRSMVYYQQNDFQKAMADYEKVLAIDPKDANIWYERGLVLNTLEGPQAAITSFNEAIRLNPNSGLFHSERARAYLNLQNMEMAESDATTAQRLGFQLPNELLSILK